MVSRLYNKDLSVCVYVCTSANAVSSRDGLDTETGTESLQSQRRERERERAHRRARESEWLNNTQRNRPVLTLYTHHISCARDQETYDIIFKGSSCPWCFPQAMRVRRMNTAINQRWGQAKTASLWHKKNRILYLKKYDIFNIELVFYLFSHLHHCSKVLVWSKINKMFLYFMLIKAALIWNFLLLLLNI